MIAVLSALAVWAALAVILLLAQPGSIQRHYHAMKQFISNLIAKVKAIFVKPEFAKLDEARRKLTEAVGISEEQWEDALLYVSEAEKLVMGTATGSQKLAFVKAGLSEVWPELKGWLLSFLIETAVAFLKKRFVGPLLILLACSLGMASCTSPYVSDGTARVYLGNLGGDVSFDSLSVGNIQITGYKNKNTEALKSTLDAIQKMWKNYLTLKGFEFITGKYYDHQGKLVDADTTKKLEELRNAKDIEIGKQKLQELEMMHAAGAA